MQFLHPLMLWGMAAASVPVIIHLIHRRRFQRQRWAAMEWLLAAVKQNQKRLQMENLLLLLVRTCAVLFLALAIARPTFSDSPLLLGPSRQTRLFVVLDNSGSTAARLGTRTTFDDCLAKVSSLVASLGSEDPVSLVLTNDNRGELGRSGRPRMILRDQTDHGTVRRRLGELKPAPARADLDEALKLVEDAVRSTDTMHKKVAIVTDLQIVSFPERTDRNALDDPIRQTLLRLRDKGAEVVLVPAQTEREVPNVAVTGLRPLEDRDVVQGSTAIFQAEVKNYSDRPRKVEVRFSVDGKDRADSDVSQWVVVPPRTAGPEAPPSQTVQFWTRFKPEEVGVHVAEVRIDTDGLGWDDVRAFAFQVRRRIQILAVDPDLRAGDPAITPETYWLKPALAPHDDGPFQVTQMSEDEYHGLRSLEGWDVIVLANVERPAPDEDSRTRLEDFVKAGGALFLTVGDHVVPQRWNEEIFRRSAGGPPGLLPVRLGEAKYVKGSVVRLDLNNSKHALLANIVDPQFVVFFQSPILEGYMTVEGVEADKSVRVALSYDFDRGPALVEKRFGKGRVLLYTSTLDKDWGHLPGANVFPALLHEAAYWLTSRGDLERNLLAFQPWNRTVPADFASIEVTTPDGTPLRPEKETLAAQSQVTVVETGQLGVYHALLQFKPRDLLGAVPPPQRDAFSVNMNNIESDLRRFDPQQVLTRYKDLILTGSDAAKASLQERAKAGEIATPLLVAALCCLLVEVLLVQRIGRRRAK